MHVMQTFETPTMVRVQIIRPQSRPPGRVHIKQQMAQKSRRDFAPPRLMAGCNAQDRIVSILISFQSQSSFFTFFCPQGKFWTHLSKTVAPLHHLHFLINIIHWLIGVQRRVQEGATGCNGGVTESYFLALHPNLKPRQFLFYALLVQGCTGKDTSKQFSTILIPVRSFQPIILIKLFNCLILLTIILIVELIVWLFRAVYYRRKYIFYMVSFLSFQSWSLNRCIKALSHSGNGLCQPVLVTWLTVRSKYRNQGTRIWGGYGFSILLPFLRNLRVIRGVRIGVKTGLCNYINSINIIKLICYLCKLLIVNGLKGMIINVSRFNILNDQIEEF
jgi:hypothetical protein